MRSNTLLLLAIVSLLIVSVGAQVPGEPGFNIVVQDFNVEQTSLFENETFTADISLLNNGTVPYQNLRVVVNERPVSLRPEESSSKEVNSTVIAEIQPREVLNLTIDLEIAAGSKILSVSFVFNNVEIPSTASLGVSVLGSPVGDNTTLLLAIGVIFSSIFILVSVQWVYDLIHLKLVRY